MIRASHRWSLAITELLIIALLVVLPRLGRAQTPTPTPTDTQKQLGTRWIQNYLNLPYIAVYAALAEIIGRAPAGSTPTAGSTSAPGSTDNYLRRNKGYFSPEVIDYFEQWLPFQFLKAPLDVLNTLTVPTPGPTDSPYLSDAKTKDGIKSFDDLWSDITRSTHAQALDIEHTTLLRTAEHAEELNNQLRDGDGRLALAATSDQRGIGGLDIERYVNHAGDIKAALEAGAHGVYAAALLQEPGKAVATDLEVPLGTQFGPSPQPAVSGALPGGSAAGADFARLTGILPGADPFKPFRNVTPNMFLDPIVHRINTIINTFGDISGALTQFGGPGPLGNLADIFGNSRTRDLLGRGGGSSPAPATTSAPEDPQCPEARAQRTKDTVKNAARLLQLPEGPGWIVALRLADTLFRIQGTNVETQERVTIDQTLFQEGSCVWVVASGNTDAVFLSDQGPTVFRLINIAAP